ncbi:MAG: RtcB family protein [Deltaproteobacteria bacterium]|nr:RtcB family protein [Deltaproteobacteria bacterium]MBW1929285.1 RtcB family protein [Deltaproteobacteria bacterium]MBW2024762.1 RtcB family protein [Deltaproteobacteria bacterium]MBW2126179.1 RtcB family protein [Deltaproteobacteria bacterium]RLB18894.1 MAG: RNA-splicing ligase RtcB [Deltaproteobacteria bacterium]
MDIKLERLDEYRWIIPKSGDMRVPGLIFSNSELIRAVREDQSLVQVRNVATLPGIVGYALAMPDIHWGYGFPIGGVAAFKIDEGVVSPGGVGYDINCGCRLMTTALEAHEIRPRIKEIISALFNNIPSGVGSTGPLKLSKKEEQKVARKGAAWAIENGFGEPEDLERTEDYGTMPGADPSVLSERALKRGMDQLGTLGSGNHFLEIQVVEKIYDEAVASAFHLFEGQITVFIHSGSRGFGHQICDDFLKEMARRTNEQEFQLPDRQLACAHLTSDLGRRYLAAMACAANYAWANRQILMHWARETLMKVLSISPGELRMNLLYDVCHNIAKIEDHTVDGKKITVCVHRKGATRALPKGHQLLPKLYSHVGQPVLIPGDMGTESYVLVGSEAALDQSFASSCHGAGRVLSRSQAIKRAKGRSINRELEDKGIFVQSRGKKTLKEEMPEAYKDVSQVVDVVHRAGLATKVARLIPLGAIKG